MKFGVREICDVVLKAKANQIILTDEFAGVCLMYQAIHGEEDRQKMPNPRDEEEFVKNFDAMFNND